MIHRLTWSGDEVKKRLFAWAKLKGGGLDHAKLARAFLAVDPSKKDKRAGYKLPMADVIRTGNKRELVAVDAGLKAANNRLEGAEVPRSVKRAGQRTLDAYDWKKSMRNQRVRRMAVRVRKSEAPAGAPLSLRVWTYSRRARALGRAPRRSVSRDVAERGGVGEGGSGC